MEKPLVSICSITYNQENFIRACLEGFVKQETNFPFEILIHDDASTDGTADIIREYQAHYPDLIKPILQTENRYSRGLPILKLNYERAQGKYIAMCEGDDCWIDHHKLQKQFDFMEAHPEYSLCSHDAIIKDYSNNKEVTSFRLQEEDYDFNFYNIIDHGMLSTHSLFFRTEFYPGIMKFTEHCPAGDFPMQVYLSTCGKIRHLKGVMGIYNGHVPGSWTSTHSQKDAMYQHQMRMYDWMCGNNVKQVLPFKAYHYMKGRRYFLLHQGTISVLFNGNVIFYWLVKYANFRNLAHLLIPQKLITWLKSKIQH